MASFLPQGPVRPTKCPPLLSAVAGYMARLYGARCAGVETEAPRTSVAKAAHIYRKN